MSRTSRCVQPWGAVGRVCKRGQTASGGSAVVGDSGRKKWTDEGRRMTGSHHPQPCRSAGGPPIPQAASATHHDIAIRHSVSVSVLALTPSAASANRARSALMYITTATTQIPTDSGSLFFSLEKLGSCICFVPCPQPQTAGSRQQPGDQPTPPNDMHPIAPRRRPFQPHFMHLFRLALLDEISLPPAAAQSKPTFGPFGPPGRPRDTPSPSNCAKNAGAGEAPWLGCAQRPAPKRSPQKTPPSAEDRGRPQSKTHRTPNPVKSTMSKFRTSWGGLSSPLLERQWAEAGSSSQPQQQPTSGTGAPGEGAAGRSPPPRLPRPPPTPPLLLLLLLALPWTGAELSWQPPPVHTHITQHARSACTHAAALQTHTRQPERRTPTAHHLERPLLVLCASLVACNAKCSSDVDPSSNRKCVMGVCLCDAPWLGNSCGEIRFKLVSFPQGYGMAPNFTARGGGAIFDGKQHHVPRIHPHAHPRMPIACSVAYPALGAWRLAEAAGGLGLEARSKGLAGGGQLHLHCALQTALARARARGPS
jgi:hypothetical protein